MSAATPSTSGSHHHQLVRALGVICAFATHSPSTSGLSLDVSWDGSLLLSESLLNSGANVCLAFPGGLAPAGTEPLPYLIWDSSVKMPQQSGCLLGDSEDPGPVIREC